MLCPHCKAPIAMSEAHWDGLGVGDVIAMPASLYKPVGCLECRQSGYLGRNGVYEVMAIGPSMQSAIAANPELINLRRLAIQGGMRPLRYAGAEKIAAGQTSIDEVLALTPDPRDR
jgi:general secretion pathway protein E